MFIKPVKRLYLAVEGMSNLKPAGLGLETLPALEVHVKSPQ